MAIRDRKNLGNMELDTVWVPGWKTDTDQIQAADTGSHSMDK